MTKTIYHSTLLLVLQGSLDFVLFVNARAELSETLRNVEKKSPHAFYQGCYYFPFFVSHWDRCVLLSFWQWCRFSLITYMCLFSFTLKLVLDCFCVINIDNFLHMYAVCDTNEGAECTKPCYLCIKFCLVVTFSSLLGSPDIIPFAVILTALYDVCAVWRHVN